MQLFSSQFWLVRYILASVSFNVRIVRYKLAIASYKVRIAGYKLFFSQLWIYIVQFCENKSELQDINCFFFVFIPHNSDFFFGTVYPGIPASFLRIVSHKVQFWGKKLSILIFSCSISLLDSQFWLCISQLLIYSTQFREKKSELQDVTLQLQLQKKKYIYFLFLFSSRNKLPYVSLYRSKEKQLN